MRSGMDLKCRLSFKYLYYAFWDISFRDMLLQGHSKRKLNVKEQILVHIYSVLLKQEYSSLPCTQIVKIDFLPTIETCFNCFGTLSSDANRHSKKDDKTAREIQKLRNLSRPPPTWWESRSRQDGASAWRRNLFSCSPSYFLIIHLFIHYILCDSTVLYIQYFLIILSHNSA